VAQMALELSLSPSQWRLEVLYSPLLGRDVGLVVTARVPGLLLDPSSLERRDLLPPTMDAVESALEAMEASMDHGETVQEENVEPLHKKGDVEDVLQESEEVDNEAQQKWEEVESVQDRDVEDEDVEEEAVEEGEVEDKYVEDEEVEDEEVEDEEVKLVQERDDQGNLVSNDFADYTKVECRVCSLITPKTRLRAHTRAAHNMTITDYKERFGSPDLVEAVYHRCCVCSQAILLDSDAVAAHLKSAVHQGITHGEYNKRFMVDSRTKQGVGKNVGAGQAPREVLDKPGNPASSSRKVEAVSKVDITKAVKDVEKVAQDSRKHSGSKEDKAAKESGPFTKEAVERSNVGPVSRNGETSEEAEKRSSLKKRSMEEKEKIEDCTDVKRSKVDMAIRNESNVNNNIEDGKIKFTVRFGGETLKVILKTPQVKMSKMMKNMRKRFKKPAATFLLGQEQVGEEELAERFQDVKIQMVE